MKNQQCLLGSAIGDALALPFEGMSKINKVLIDWDGKDYIDNEYHEVPKAHFSDDTILSLALAISLIENNGFDIDNVAKSYLTAIEENPTRGYGRSTLLAIQNIKNLISPKHSGIPNALGNGTAMRAAPLGVFFKNDVKSLFESVKDDAFITHASDEAWAGSLAVAYTVSLLLNNCSKEDLLKEVIGVLPKSSVKDNLLELSKIGHDKKAFNKTISHFGNSGDVRQTIPCVLNTFLTFDNAYEGIVKIIKTGGDTDSNASISLAFYSVIGKLSDFPENIINQIEAKEFLTKVDNLLFKREG